jgi:Uma2 family endonuclease
MNRELHSPPVKLEPRQRFVLWNLGWDGYDKIVEALNEQHVRSTYDRGDLELMSPLPIHEAIKVWCNHFLLALGLELGVPFKSMGQTTFRRRDLDRGLEPDDCYYLAGIDRVGDWSTLSLDRDPPPDLVVEVDITRSCLDRMGVYAGLGVPEVWRFDGEELHVHILNANGEYEESSQSAAFPYLPMNEVTPLLRQALESSAGDGERIQTLCRWVRERVLPHRQAWQQQQQTPPPPAHP